MTDKLSQATAILRELVDGEPILSVIAQARAFLSTAQPTEPSPTSAEVFAQCEKLRGKHYHVEPTDRESIDMLVTLVNQRNNDKAAEIEAAQPPHAEEAGLDLSAFDGHTPGPWHWVDSRDDKPWESGYIAPTSLQTIERFQSPARFQRPARNTSASTANSGTRQKQTVRKD